MITVLLAASAGLTSLAAYEFATKLLLREPVRQELVERVDVGEQAAHEIADGSLVEERDRQRLKLLEQLFADLGQHVLSCRAHAARLRAAGDPFFLFCSLVQGLLFQFWWRLSLRSN